MIANVGVRYCAGFFPAAETAALPELRSPGQIETARGLARLRVEM